METAAARVSYSATRDGDTFIPAVFDYDSGKLGDQRLGSRALGGGLFRGIGTESSRALALERGPAETWVARIEAEAERTEIRNPETWMGAVKTEADDIVPSWRIDGLQIPKEVDELRDWQELNLTFRVTESILRNRLKVLKSNDGSVDTVVGSDGTFRSLDRASGANTYELIPPTARAPPRLGGDYLVDGYSQDALDQEGGTFEVEATFVDDESRSTSSGLAETRDAGEWLLELSEGDVATSRVSQRVGVGAKAGEATRSVELMLTAEQAKCVEESLTALGAVTVHEVPDGENFAVDENPDSANTVMVTAPTGADDVLPGGEYAATEWETAWVSEDFYRVRLELVETA